jgi:hypothetical protein
VRKWTHDGIGTEPVLSELWCTLPTSPGVSIVDGLKQKDSGPRWSCSRPMKLNSNVTGPMWQ